MELTFDLRFAADAPQAGADSRRVVLDELAATCRRPGELARLLWAHPNEVVRAVEDPLAPTAIQAGALLLASLARSRRFELAVSDATAREIRRSALLARAVVRLATATPREAVQSARLLRELRAELAEPVHTIPLRGGARSIAFLRTSPSLAYLGAYVGGAAAHTTGVINGFAEHGLDVWVYAAERPDGIAAVSFVRVPLQRVFHLVQWLTVSAFSTSVVKAAQQAPVEAVYHRYVLGSLAGVQLAARLHVPLILEFNGSEVWSIHHWGSGRLPHAQMLEAIEQRNLRAASLIVVVSEVLKEELLARGIDAARILVNPNGVDVDRLAPLRQRTTVHWRRELGLAEAPTVGFVGTWGMWHGVTVLPEMISTVASERADVRWILLGDGRLRPGVTAEIRRRGLADRVHAPGIVSHGRALEFLAACDVCVSPHVHNPDGTRFFGSPTKLFEYMGLGRAIVASDLEQIGDVLEHERTALLCAPGDAVAAGRSVLRLLADAEERVRLGLAALDEASSKYSWVAHVGRILSAVEAGSAAIGPLSR
jgi:glycosyltransferase involved in cell wall biosynthesis